jgi:hypothetical protein
MTDGTQQQPPDQAEAPKRLFVRRIRRGLFAFALMGILAFAGIWATAALRLADLDGASPRIWTPITFVLAFLLVLIRIRPRRRACLIAVVMVVGVAVWFFTIAPSNDREWTAGHARLATATIDGDRVTLHNYRVMEPGADGALRETYTDRTFDVRELVRADLIMSYWGPKRIAHALVSFEFTEGRHVAMSIEVRRRASQRGFNMASSLFRNFELIYIVGNERALIGAGMLDDYHRIFLYRTSITPQRTRALFLRYAQTLNELARAPRWYNAVTDNCTTGIYMHLRHIPPPPRFSMTIWINGYLPEYIYDQGLLGTSISWSELNRRCDIKEAGRRAYDSPEFSRLIRQDVPIPSGGRP